MNKPRNRIFKIIKEGKSIGYKEYFSAPTGSRCFFLLKLLDSDAKNQKLQ
jgi:hypothetical protein